MAVSPARVANHAKLLKTNKRSAFFRWLLRLLYAAMVLALVLVAGVSYTYHVAVRASRGRTYDDVSQVPPTKVGLVFGTTDRDQNLYFRYRIEAAIALWKAKKIETLIVSGDNRTHQYNEPEKMRQALIKGGIPPKHIVRDYAGLRTLDSVVRAKEIFGETSILFISQRFQNERAIYLAKANGIDARGFNARDVDNRFSAKTNLREIGARVEMWLDVNILKTRPRYLGKKEELPD